MGLANIGRDYRSFERASASRVMLAYPGPGERRPDDRHSIALLIQGEYFRRSQDGEISLSGPSAMFHPARQWYVDNAGPAGAELLTIQFDQSWLPACKASLQRSRAWRGGRAALAARALAAAWADPLQSESSLAQATARFLGFASGVREEPRPAWLSNVEKALKGVSPPSTDELARRLRLHPAWLARVYRASVGEGMKDTVRRTRTERASRLLRDTDWCLAEVALAAGFCDQSHMNRCFRSLLDRTPLQVRNERAALIEFDIAA